MDRNAASDAMFTTLAPPAERAGGQPVATADREAHRPDEVDARAAANVSGSHSSRPPGKLAPALFTSTSSMSSVDQRVDRSPVSVIST